MLHAGGRLNSYRLRTLVIQLDSFDDCIVAVLAGEIMREDIITARQ